jgi:ribonuclease J
LTTLYGWLKPRYLLPVHGEQRHQDAHLQLGRRLGLDGIVPRNGDLISLAGKPCIVGSTPVGKVLQQR